MGERNEKVVSPVGVTIGIIFIILFWGIKKLNTFFCHKFGFFLGILG